LTTHRDTSFRDSIALVPQESMLFQGGIALNIGLGARPGHEVAPQQIEDACKLANIHDVIDSKGQRQQESTTSRVNDSTNQRQQESTAAELDNNNNTKNNKALGYYHRSGTQKRWTD
jgi:ABC-type multidrug transport system fused ATPase/permease subunit